ncbi:MAG: fibronectin type III domain-containing protein, partial [Candidatus Limnocylindrales bacterium]
MVAFLVAPLSLLAPVSPGIGTVDAVTPAPVLVQAQGLNGSTIRLLWTAVPGATAYKVYRDGASTELASPTSTGFDDHGVAPLSTHSYVVTAITGAESAPSVAATATVQAADDTSPPTTPGTISAKSVTSSSAKLSWTRSKDNVGIEGYRVLIGPAGTPAAQLVDIWTTDDVPSYTATNLRAGTGYVFGVIAVDAAGNVSPTRTKSVTTSTSTDSAAPSAPGNLTARVFSSSRIDLYWSPSTSSDVSGYNVLRNGVVVDQVNLPARMNFSDNGLSPSTSYTYTVRAIDSAGNESTSSVSRAAATFAAGTVIVARGPYVQWVTTTSARIAWWTNLPTQSVVSCSACPQVTSVDPTPTLEHVMLVGGLAAGTTYTYAVGDGTASAPGSFSTAAPEGTSFSFAALGDFGGGSIGATGNASQIANDGTSFIQTLGDNIYPEAADPNYATTYSDFDGRFYRPFGPALAKKAFWAANGNKEYYGSGAWFTHMWLPNNERWYSYDWGDAHILVLDTEQPFAPGTPQYAFAEADLAAHQSATWRIVAIQRPPYSSSSANSSSVPVRSYLVPLFEAQKVSLVLAGNSHNYERTHPLLSNGDPNNPTVSPNDGITYVVSGNGGNG